MISHQKALVLILAVKNTSEPKNYILMQIPRDNSAESPSLPCVRSDGDISSLSEAAQRVHEAFGIDLRYFLPKQTSTACRLITHGTTQCFAVCIEGARDEHSQLLTHPRAAERFRFTDVDSIHRLPIAPEQKRLIFDTFNQFGIPYDNGELLAAFDPNGTPNGEGIPRKKAHAEGILHGASHIYICKRTGDEIFYLLQRRSNNKDSYPGCLDTSSAGHIELGSDFLDTARKELWEELGVACAPDDLIELFTQSIYKENQFHGKTFLDREINRVYLLRWAPDPSQLKLQAAEVSEVVWLSERDIFSMLDQSSPELCLNGDEFQKVAAAVRTILKSDNPN